MQVFPYMYFRPENVLDTMLESEEIARYVSLYRIYDNLRCYLYRSILPQMQHAIEDSFAALATDSAGTQLRRRVIHSVFACNIVFD